MTGLEGGPQQICVFCSRNCKTCTMEVWELGKEVALVWPMAFGCSSSEAKPWISWLHLALKESSGQGNRTTEALGCIIFNLHPAA